MLSRIKRTERKGIMTETQMMAWATVAIAAATAAIAGLAVAQWRLSLRIKAAQDEQAKKHVEVTKALAAEHVDTLMKLTAATLAQSGDADAPVANAYVRHLTGLKKAQKEGAQE
jgi:hypothetical protein